MKRPQPIVYPFLAAVYPVLALAVANGGELVTVRDLVRPAALSLAFASAVWLLARFATRDPHRRAVLTFIAVLAFASYGYWQALLVEIPPLAAFAADHVALPATLGVLLLVAYGARRGGRSYAGLSPCLNLLMGLLVAVPAIQLSVTRSRTRPAARFDDLPVRTVGAGAGAAEQPHLFLIVLDKYTGSGSLRANFGFDNAPFEEALESRGFRVARHAHANYVHTFLALASMLNWDYADGLGPALRTQGGLPSDAYSLIEDNRTWRALRALGYRFVFMPTGYAATAGNRYADLQLPHPDQLTREFEGVWLRTTMLHPVIRAWCERAQCTGTLVPFVHESAESIDWKFEQLASLAQSQRPLFVFAHLAVPHEPYIYGADCRHAVPYWPRRGGGEDAGLREAYVAQLTCLNRMIERLAARLGEGARPAIVILQSDHGHGWIGLDQPTLAATPPSVVAERLDIFAAYRLPGAPPDLVHDSIGPVNAMRAIMSHYFGLDLPPRPEASYWSERKYPYRLTRLR